MLCMLISRLLLRLRIETVTDSPSWLAGEAFFKHTKTAGTMAPVPVLYDIDAGRTSLRKHVSVSYSNDFGVN